MSKLRLATVIMGFICFIAIIGSIGSGDIRAIYITIVITFIIAVVLRLLRFLYMK